MSNDKPLVGVIMGSTSDSDIMQKCIDILENFEIPHEVRVLSAHRTPDLTREYAVSAADRGIELIIAGAGLSAHLPGFMAAHTSLPVIGIPIDSSSFGGMDSLLSIVQMPPGIPVATVAVGAVGAKNAAFLTAQILALKYPHFAERLNDYRKDLAKSAR